MATKNGHSLAPSPPRPAINLPPRPSMEAFFTSGPGLSPGPMTLVSSFFSDSYPDSDCRSFSQLLAGAMASPLALGTRPSFLPDNSTSNSSTSEDAAKKNLGFKQSRPMNLVVGRSPLFTIPPGLSPSGLLNSPGFFSPQSPFGMSHQQALAQVTAQAVLAQSQMHAQGNFHPSVVTAPSEPLAVQPSSTPGEGLELQVVSAVSEPKGSLVEISEISHADNKYQASSIGVDKPADDGYNWRKYGQKQVKGSYYPRSYYKCTHLNCPVKKKIERGHDGHITEIIYKGQHDHEKPQPNRRAAKDNCESNENKSIQVMSESNTKGCVGNPNVLGESMPDHSMPESDHTSNQEAPRQSSGSHGSEEALDANITEDGDVGEPNPKRRSTKDGASEASLSHKTVTEPKIILQTRSEVDLLDDGYRWRKYGQKVVKGNPHPRSYYKCTFAGCNVRKHVERSSTDPKAVITTYEGNHNHDLPASRHCSHITSATTNSMPLKQYRVTPGNNEKNGVYI